MQARGDTHGTPVGGKGAEAAARPSRDRPQVAYDRMGGDGKREPEGRPSSSSDAFRGARSGRDGTAVMPRDASSTVVRPRLGDGRGRPSYDGRGYRPAWRGDDHRFARPYWRTVSAYRGVSYVPSYAWYRPLYTRWWVHPYYRWVYATTACVWFDWAVDPWVATWAPPTRTGWSWVPGYYDAWGYWVPGYWTPTRVAPTWTVGSYRQDYVYVPGWWNGTIYVEGYWRVRQRRDGQWVWVDGAYGADGVYRWGHWEPASPAPAGYVWEAGYWDGSVWVGGFWRPQYRDGFRWVSAWYDSDGVLHSGYWEPTVDRPGYVWIPGWFDGKQWITGYWVAQTEYEAADPSRWEPEPGWDSGHDEVAAPPSDDAPLALPIE